MDAKHPSHYKAFPTCLAWVIQTIYQIFIRYAIKYIIMSFYATLHQFAQLYAPLRHFTLLYTILRLFTPLYATLLYLRTPISFTPGWSLAYLFEVVFVKCVWIWRTSVFFQFYWVLSGVIYNYSTPTPHFFYYYSKSHFFSRELCYW